MFVQIAVDIPVENTFTYAVPAELESAVAVGKRVLAPFGKKQTTGYVIAISALADREELKPISEVLDEEPLFSAEDLRFFQWSSDYYLYPLGRLLKEVLPGGINTVSNTWIIPMPGRQGPFPILSPAAADLMAFLNADPGGAPLKRVKEAFAGGKIDALLKRLREAGLIELEERLRSPQVSRKRVRVFKLADDHDSDYSLMHSKQPTPRQKEILDYLALNGEATATDLNGRFKNASSLLRALREKRLIAVEERELLRNPVSGSLGEQSSSGPVLNPDQYTACKALRKAISSRKFKTVLLHGVTGSGKTEVYFQAVSEALKAGGSVIYLVPEIALTPQLLGRVRARFADREIAIMHSGISESARYDQWRRISRGDLRIVIGARSAVFAPARNLRLIVVDEEHDSSYKQDDRMRYNARDLAIIKASQQSAVAILGSATPAVQTYHHAVTGKYHRLSLPRRVEDRPLPAVHIVDMKFEMGSKGKPAMLSRPLIEGVRETLDRGKQVMLFLNRRGYHTFVCCYSCGHVFKCLNCSVSLTHHAAAGVLKCHYCDFSIKALPLCPVCCDGRIGTYGMGTEKLEEEIAERFPGAIVQRMDSDTTAQRGVYEKILKRFANGEIDILIGTQMITKGHDFPNVLLVGIISADMSLNLPDFRAAEKTFQVLTQVAGRGGRGVDLGRVYVQTFNPDHYAVQLAGSHDFTTFFEREISLRKEFAYPPFSRIVSIQISSNVLDKAIHAADEIGAIARRLAAANRISVMGPAEAPIARIKGKHRRHILLKGGSIAALHTLVKNILKMNPVKDVIVKVDVDPVNFM